MTPETTRAPSALLGLIAALLLVAAPVKAQTTLRGDLPRGAELGFRTASEDGRLLVRDVAPGSPAARAGLAEGDAITAVADRGFERPYVGRDLLRRLDGDVEAVLTVQRGGVAREIRFTPPPRPLEEVEGLEIVYDHLETPDGARLRTLATRPAGTNGPLPAVFFVQWVSCDTVELGGSAVSQVMQGLAERSGMVFLRVERSASGDSEGPGCHELDYDTELAHYRFALDTLVGHPWVDRHRVVVWGESLGSTFAPQLAVGREVAGVVMVGGGAQTYIERMIQFDRIGFERGGLDPREIQERMLQHIRFHVLYLLDGEDPDAIARRHPELAGVWDRIRGTGDGVHYGRPYAYHRQAAGKDLLEAWLEVEAPVLVLYGEYDQFEYAHGHELVARMVNRLRPGSARYVGLPRTGHSFRAYPSAEDAAAWSLGQPVPELVLQPILEWLRDEVGIESVRLQP